MLRKLFAQVGHRERGFEAKVLVEKYLMCSLGSEEPILVVLFSPPFYFFPYLNPGNITHNIIHPTEARFSLDLF